MKTNEPMGTLCGLVVIVFVMVIVLLGGIVNLALSQAEKDSKKVIDYSKRVL